MKKLILILLIIFSGFFSFNIYAKCVKDAQVKYKQQHGWSKKYSVEVTFMTGSELNSATNTYNYSSYSVYGIIFWGNNEASVIKISSFTLCGFEVTCDCISSMYDLKGVDQDGDEWNICLSNFCY